MRLTVDVDDGCLASAEEYTGIEDKNLLLNAALIALVEREASHMLARLGGSAPDLKPVPRRRPPHR